MIRRLFVHNSQRNASMLQLIRLWSILYISILNHLSKIFHVCYLHYFHFRNPLDIQTSITLLPRQICITLIMVPLTCFNWVRINLIVNIKIFTFDCIKLGVISGMKIIFTGLSEKCWIVKLRTKYIFFVNVVSFQ